MPFARFSGSLDDNIEELVPVRRFKAGKAHRETLDFLYYVVFYVKVINPTFVRVSHEFDLEQAFLYQIIEVIIVA